MILFLEVFGVLGVVIVAGLVTGTVLAHSQDEIAELHRAMRETGDVLLRSLLPLARRLRLVGSENGNQEAPE